VKVAFTFINMTSPKDSENVSNNLQERRYLQYLDDNPSAQPGRFRGDYRPAQHAYGSLFGRTRRLPAPLQLPWFRSAFCPGRHFQTKDIG
jgi:hypothetical protein